MTGRGQNGLLFFEMEGMTVNSKVRDVQVVFIYCMFGFSHAPQEIEQREIASLKDALKENKTLYSDTKLSFLVSQSNHNLVVVPYLWQQMIDPTTNRIYYYSAGSGRTEWEQPDTPENVPSGCYVDHKDFLPKGRNHGGKSYDFLLTAHGGLKGTSKPILYRCLWHENPDEFGKEALIKMTYCCSFFYGTASKSIREPAILRYASREGKRILSAINSMNLQFAEYRDDAEDVSIFYHYGSKTLDIMENFGCIASFENRRVMQEPFYTNLAA